MSFTRLYEEVKKAKLIFVGEIHDIQAHHQRELEIVRAFHESGAPLAIGLEMFRADSQQALDDWVGGTLSLDRFLPAYYDNWRQQRQPGEDIIVLEARHPRTGGARIDVYPPGRSSDHT